MIDNGPDRHPVFRNDAGWQDARRWLHVHAAIQGRVIHNVYKPTERKMEILSYHVKMCEKCFKLTGYVFEKWNAKVPVFCQCQIANREHSVHSRQMIGQVLPNGKIHFLWIPGSSHVEADGQCWHTPVFAYGSGLRSGVPEDLKVFEEWKKTFPEQMIETT
jgi:hypothetical protein